MPTTKSAWVVAAWPGMAGVGQIACAYLHDALAVTPIAELGANGFFAPESIRVEKGLVLPQRRPRSIVSSWSDASCARDLLLVQGEQQPASDSMRYARAVLDSCGARPIERIITFAALATAMDPRDEPRVFAACTTPELLKEALALTGVAPLDGADVSGMNGEFLDVARERGIPAMCLLGEVPFFATSLPNPKASAALLVALSAMLGVSLPLAGLREQARRIEGWLVRQLEGSEAAQRGRSRRALAEQIEDEKAPAANSEPARDREDLQRIEALFELAKQDRAKAQDLKQELDRLGLFRSYEDRFLDLFRKGS